MANNKYLKNEVLCIEVEIENLVLEGNKEIRTIRNINMGITLNQKRTGDYEINNRITKARRIIAYLNNIL